MKDSKLSVTRSVKFPERIDVKLREMADYYSSSLSGMIVIAINEYYGDKYRKEVAGYHGGTDKFQKQLDATIETEKKEKQAERQKNMTVEELCADVGGTVDKNTCRFPHGLYKDNDMMTGFCPLEELRAWLAGEIEGRGSVKDGYFYPS